MKVLLKIKDARAPFVLERLKNLPFVKTKNLTPYKAKILEDVREAVEELNLIKSELEARNAEELYYKCQMTNPKSQIPNPKTLYASKPLLIPALLQLVDAFFV